MPPLSDADKIDAGIAFVPVHIAVLTVSDTRTKDDDVSGDTLVKRLQEAGHILCARTILPDDQARIVAQLKTWIEDPRCDVVISTGGTGLTGRDVTVEAFKSVFEKEIDGFCRALPSDFLCQDRHLDGAVPRLRGRGGRDLSLRPARIARRGEGWLGRHPQMAARYPPPTLQFRRDHAQADGKIGSNRK